MKVPEDIILLWTDDNSGNLLRTPLSNETDRAAGAGVYYHFDYVGSPRNYKWINTIQLIKTWEQMHLAYTKEARSLWIANVGDIKPLVRPFIPDTGCAGADHFYLGNPYDTFLGHGLRYGKA